MEHDKSNSALPRTLYTRQRLDAAQCADPGCTAPGCKTLVLSPICHPGAPVVASYTHGTGALRLECYVCGLRVCHVAVAAERGLGGALQSTHGEDGVA